MSNSASRLASVVAALNGGDISRSAIDQWARVLQLPDDEVRAQEAVAAMQAALLEVSAVEAKLQRLGAPPELFSATSKWLRNAFSAQHSGGAWRDVLQPANHAQILNTLGWAGWVLREFDDPEIDGAALEDLLASVGELERILADGGLSPAIHDLLARQVAELRRALRLYTVQGSGPLQQAYSAGVAGLMTVPAETVDQPAPQDGPAMRKSVDVLERVGKAAKVGTDLLKFFTEFAGASNSAISHISQLLLPG